MGDDDSRVHVDRSLDMGEAWKVSKSFSRQQVASPANTLVG